MSFLLESVILCMIGGVLGCLCTLPFGGFSTGTANWQQFSEITFTARLSPGCAQHRHPAGDVHGSRGRTVPCNPRDSHEYHYSSEGALRNRAGYAEAGWWSFGAKSQCGRDDRGPVSGRRQPPASVRMSFLKAGWMPAVRVRSGLLLSHAVVGTESPDEIDGVDANDPVLRMTVLQ